MISDISRLVYLLGQTKICPVMLNLFEHIAETVPSAYIVKQYRQKDKISLQINV